MTKRDEQSIILKALALWGLEDAEIHLAARRENIVYQIDHEKGRFALRLHRVGYRDHDELTSELMWMNALAEGGMKLPKPQPSLSNEFIQTIDGVAVDVLTWLDGVPMRHNGVMLDHPNMPDIYHKLGQAMAELHMISDKWDMPAKFNRAKWNREGLLGGSPLWGKFWENPNLNTQQVRQIKAFQLDAIKHLKSSDDLDYGLIHADLVPDNVLVRHHQNKDELYLIDFDDGGFGYRLFDLATTLHHGERTDHADAYRTALLSGYMSRRHIDLAQLPLFQALRALTYIGWIMPRIAEEGGEQRNKRFINEAFMWMDRA